MDFNFPPRKKLKSAYAFYAEKDANLIYEIGTKGKALDLNAVFNSIDKLSQQDVAKVKLKIIYLLLNIKNTCVLIFN